MTMLYYEKLDVDQASIELTAAAVLISSDLPKGCAALGDQLRRAAMSIPLNIAEGVGKTTPGEQARFHAIARGSAMETGAILDVVQVLNGPSESGQNAKALVVRVVEMLTRMCR